MSTSQHLHIVASPEAPHAIAAERALLGALLYNNDLWDEIDGDLAVEHFYDKRHQVIFAAVQKLLSESRADVVLLVQALKNDGKLGDAGGEEYVFEIENISAAIINVSAYSEEIKKTAMLRKMHGILQNAHARVLHPGGNTPREILDETEALLGEVAADTHSGGGFVSAADKASEFFQYLANIVNKGEFDRLLGIKTGYSRLDQMTTGLHGGDFIVLAARPGGGKTAFALNIIRHVSATGDGVAVFSLEMSDRQLVMRMMSQDQIDMQKMRTGKDYRGRPMSAPDWQALGQAEGRLRERHIYIDDSSVLNIFGSQKPFPPSGAAVGAPKSKTFAYCGGLFAVANRPFAQRSRQSRAGSRRNFARNESVGEGVGCAGYRVVAVEPEYRDERRQRTRTATFRFTRIGRDRTGCGHRIIFARRKKRGRGLQQSRRRGRANPADCRQTPQRSGRAHRFAVS